MAHGEADEAQSGEADSGEPHFGFFRVSIEAVRCVGTLGLPEVDDVGEREEKWVESGG